MSDGDRDEIIRLIQSGRPLPPRYKATLFEDAPEAELVWPGKTSDVERIVLPFQSIEHIDEPRSGTEQQFDLFSIDSQSGRQTGGWTNKLIWGDNKLVLSSLANGPVRQQIEDAGGLKLVYIDPPFDVGADFSVQVTVGDAAVEKRSSVVEEVAYRDTWGRGRDSYLAMLNERLRLISDLLHPDGAILVHLDWRVDYLVRLLLDEIFGTSNYRNSIVWQYGGKGLANVSSTLVRNYGTIQLYSKSDGFIPNLHSGEISESVQTRWGRYMDNEGKITFASLKNSGEELELSKATASFIRNNGREPQDDDVARDYGRGSLYRDVWTDISIIRENEAYREYVGYPTQKPEALLSRLVQIGSNEGDLVADFFCGSGTTLAVAERLGRKWIGADLGRFAVHTTRKRLIGVQRELAERGEAYRAFEILNLGSYERQYFVGIDPTLPAEQREAASTIRREQYLELILSAYGAKRSEQATIFHGFKDTAAVFVGPLDAPVTQRDVTAVVAAARNQGIGRVDVLGFEFEMGIKPAMVDEAKDQGITLTLRYVPNEVFDRRAVQRGQVKFYDVGYLEAKPIVNKDGSVTIQLVNFAVFYAQEDADAAAEGLRPGAARVVVDNGQVVRVSKNKKGVIQREILTKQWSDWIDYWAVDFDFESQKEVITQEAEGQLTTTWTGRYIFENQWQDFRSRGARELALKSAPHTYSAPGSYKVAVKVVDVFGNDTTKVIKVKVK